LCCSSVQLVVCSNSSNKLNIIKLSNFSRFTKPVRSCSRIMLYKMLFDRFVGFAYLYTVLDMPRQIRIVCLQKVTVLCFVNNRKTQHRAWARYLDSGLFVPLHFRSRERKVDREIFRFHGTFVLWNIRSWGAKSPRTFVSWNFLTPGTFRLVIGQDRRSIAYTISQVLTELGL